MPDGNEILIGHGIGVMYCFSCSCGFWSCPIVPDLCRALSEPGFLKDSRIFLMPDGNEILIGHGTGVMLFSPLAVFLCFRQFFFVRFLCMLYWAGISERFENHQFPQFSAVFPQFSAVVSLNYFFSSLLQG